MTIARCVHRPPCPGCPRFGDDGLGPGLERLEQLALEHAAGPVERVSGPAAGYRHRVRLSVRAGKHGPELGIFQLGSHRLVSIPDCVVHHPSIARLHRWLERRLAALAIEAYDEAGHRGLLRAVQIAVERSSGLVQVVLVLRDALGPGSSARDQLASLLAELSAETGLVHSVWLNAQPQRTNTLLGPHFEHVSGPLTLRDESGGAEVFYPPGAFGQANPALHDQAISRIHALVDEGARVTEYHAGVGSIGLGLGLRARVVLNEVGPGSLEGLELGIAALAARLSGRPPPELARGPADEHVAHLNGADVVILDPPRKGLSPGLLAGLVAVRPPSLAYLSCGLESFLEDSAVLAGAYRLERLSAFGYFPYTEHIETLGIFRARQPR